MRRWFEQPETQAWITVVIAAATALTGLFFLIHIYPIGMWLLIIFYAGVVVVEVVRRRIFFSSMLATVGGAFIIMQFFINPHLSDHFFAGFGIMIQIIIYVVLLFPLAYFWSDSREEPSSAADPDREMVLITFGVLALCGLCFGVGYLVALNTLWAWLILGLWVLVFPKGITAQKFSAVSAVIGLTGLTLVVTAIVNGWIPQKAMFTGTAYLLGVMTLITVMMLGSLWNNWRAAKTAP
jgi:hypothetical protein